MNGTVKFFDNSRGFGFIARESAEDIFVHVSNVHDVSADGLVAGQAVQFDVTQGRKGDEASNVRPI